MSSTLNPREVVPVFWTQWGTGEDRAATLNIARAVVRGSWAFILSSLEGSAPAHFCLMKSPGRGAEESGARQDEREAWETAVTELREEVGGHTEIQFDYFPVKLPVCSAWATCWELSRWWEKGSILAFPAMDLVEASLYLNRLDVAPQAVKAAVAEAPLRFRHLLEQTTGSEGLTLGGYRTYETEADPGEKRRRRRGGLPAKDLIEAAFRCYAAGALAGYKPFEDLLDRVPDLRMRSEIIGIHRNAWFRLERARHLAALEPWETTLQLIVACLMEGNSIQQEDFGWMVEHGSKSDRAVVEQLRRGLHLIERVRLSAFDASVSKRRGS